MAIPRERFERLVAPMCGMPVSRAWLGYGSVAFLELGNLSNVRGSSGIPSEKGEVTVAFDWSWRVERNLEILGGTSEGRPRLRELLQELQGRIIEKVSLDGHPPDLCLHFDDGTRLRSMTTNPPDPKWAVDVQGRGWIHFSRGELRAVNTSRDVADPKSDAETWLIAHSEATAARWGESDRPPDSGRCLHCRFFVWLDGHFLLLDYGACTNPASALDGQVTHRDAGCDAFTRA